MTDNLGNIPKPSMLKKVSVITAFFIFLFGGIFIAVIAISKFQNYDHPWLFAFTFGSIGIITGIVFGKKIKRYIILNPTMLSNYSQFIVLISAGFVGLSMWLGQMINSQLSYLNRCDNFIVEGKEFHKGGYRKPETRILIFNIDGRTQRLICGEKFWRSLSVGQPAKVCIYNGKIGFDYFVLPDNIPYLHTNQ